MTDDAARDLDVVVFGATGFVGRLVAAHLAEHAPEPLRIGLGGRSEEKLRAARDRLPERARDWPLVVADTSDPESLRAMAESTRVVATTVGPYARHGLPLVEACARAGTDYCDLTGEVAFVRQSIDRCHDTAAASGARIVHSVGFDSVPSDLSVLVAAEQARADGEGELTDTVLSLESVKGGVSGGTIDSMRTQMEAMAKDADLRRLVFDPYSLSPERPAEPDLGDQRDRMVPGREPLLGRWVAPFVMASYNTRVVRRSNALTGWSYGRGLRYREVMGVGTSPLAPVLATVLSAGIGAGVAGMAFGPTRRLLDRVLPKPGEGPSEKTMREGSFRTELVTRTSTGAEYVVTFAAKGDPGYAATAVMQGESALALALDRDRLPAAAGVLTPATALGSVLVERLRARGFEISVRRAA